MAVVLQELMVMEVPGNQFSKTLTQPEHKALHLTGAVLQEHTVMEVPNFKKALIQLEQQALHLTEAVLQEHTVMEVPVNCNPPSFFIFLSQI
jgi:hypothetical protein